jgi:hypothetical protein
MTAISGQLLQGYAAHFAAFLSALPGERFVLTQQEMTPSLRAAAGAKMLSLVLELPNVSLHCKKCDRREAFSPVWYVDVSKDIETAVATGVSKKVALSPGLQFLFLVYQCQRCLGVPESFLVRRESWSLSLHGRSPIEFVELPKYIPKTESKYYRDAIIAFNSGKTLAGLFYLRTFIEQFARRVLIIEGRLTGEELFDQYKETLPSHLKDAMPSLRECYERLSEALHSAREDINLFESVQVNVEKHFEIRQVFNIPESLPAPQLLDGSQESDGKPGHSEEKPGRSA